MPEQQRLLVIAPHADDEVLGCGGAIQHHKAQGSQVFVAIVANRILGHEIDPDHIAKTKRDTAKVAEFLGVEEVFFNDLRDEQLDHKLIDVITPIEHVVETVHPHLVFIPNKDDTDQDHRAVAAACDVACRDVDTVMAYEVPGPSRYFQPNWYLDIAQYIDQKIQAMTLYGNEWRPYPHPRSPEGLRIHAQARGLECKLPFAEGFRLLRHIIRATP